MTPRRAVLLLAVLAGLHPACEDSPTEGSLAVTCSASPSSGTVPVAVRFTANPTGGGGNYTISWSFGDGTGASDASATRTYAAPGVYQASVEVRTPGQRASCSTTVTAVPKPAPPPRANTLPVAAFKVVPNPPIGAVPLEVHFNACESADPDGDRLLFIFDVGDGPYESAHCRRTHVYRTAGTWATKFCVTDDQPGTEPQCRSDTVTAR